jgi:uncharacterized membrane protein HdeD (DUF308 family)
MPNAGGGSVVVVVVVVVDETITTLAVIMGIWLIIYGLLEIALSLQLRRLSHA